MTDLPTLSGPTVAPFSGGKPTSLVILLHGYGNSKADHANQAIHLASWGIVTAAPDTQRGLAPSVLTLAADLMRVQDVLATVQEDLMPHRLCEYLYGLAEVDAAWPLQALRARRGASRPPDAASSRYCC